MVIAESGSRTMPKEDSVDPASSGAFERKPLTAIIIVDFGKATIAV